MQQLVKYAEGIEVASANVGDIFSSLDVNTETRAEYEQRISLLLAFLKGQPFNHDIYLSFKRHLGERNDLSISTKNKYLFTAKVFLRELYRRGLIPADITVGVKGFKQNKKHKRPGVTDSD